MVTIKQLWPCLTGPRLYRVHDEGEYDPPRLERYGERAIGSLSLAWRMGFYASPIIALYLYRRDQLHAETLTRALGLAAKLGLVALVSLCMRAYGRANNPQYLLFARDYAEASAEPAPSRRTSLRKYDFDFAAWPVDFDCGRTPRVDPPGFYSAPPKFEPTGVGDAALKLFARIAVETFAMKLIYPGSTSLVNALVQGSLLTGRIKLVEEHRARRYKVRTRDENDLDCMFVDRRGISPNGRSLVITAEGNAGFYEVGVMSTPIGAGHSTLGWNHPGFGYSTGAPYPIQEQYAIDAVIQFATKELGFEIKDITLFGWSIGCYSIAWAASRYKNFAGVVMDATFDDLLPLAVAKMPPSWAPLVREVVRGHFDLNVAEAVRGYSGPLRLVRRTADEIICVEEGRLETNRGNDLLVAILADRHPDVVGQDQKTLLMEYLGLKGNSSVAAFKSADHPGDADRNKKALFLAEKYLIDYKSTHCTPLPPTYFKIPSEVVLDDDFVFT